MAGAGRGGAEKFFARLCLALEATGIEQRVLIRRAAATGRDLAGGAIAVESLRFAGWFDLTSRTAFRRAIEAFDADIVLTWMNRATRLCPRKESVCARFVHAARLGGYYNLKYYRRCDHLIGNTRDIADHLVSQGWPPERVHYLPNFVAVEASRALPRESLNTPGEAPLVVALGRLHPNKGFDVLLQALTRLPDCYLWLAGAGPLEAELRSQADACGVAGRVRFLGWCDNVGGLFRSADLFVCPSRLEPLGNVVIEAWAHGAPVIATAAQGPRALIRDGVDGLLAPVDDADGLADAMARVLDSTELAAALVAAGREAYRRDFTEQAVVAGYLEFFERITG